MTAMSRAPLTPLIASRLANTRSAPRVGPFVCHALATPVPPRFAIAMRAERPIALAVQPAWSPGPSRRRQSRCLTPAVAHPVCR